MSFFPCGSCGVMVPGKLSTVYWAWYLADSRRICYRQRLCVACFGGFVAPIYLDAFENPGNCPGCHTAPGEDLDGIYATICLPKRAKEDVSLAYCSVHAVGIREFAQRGAEKMPDREESVGGSRPPTVPLASDPWADIGLAIRPPAREA